MFLIVLLLPIFGAACAGFFANYVGRFGTTVISTGFMILTFFISTSIFYDVGLLGNTTYINLGSWISTDLIVINWGFLFDSLTVVMLMVVTSVSTLVHIYSCGYMAHDPHLPRFMSYLSLFTFFMLILITADNFIQLFVGWEGVGLCSYLLISFWFTRVQAVKSALKALIMNRIGDCGFLFGTFVLCTVFKTTDFATVFTLVPYAVSNDFFLCGYRFDLITTACLFLFVGSVGKSAQLGLHTWLPDAMEGPTPVSALIHAATMVTAGVFLIIRCSPIFEYSNTALLVITLVGALTAFFAATIGIFQNDIKKIIAYSTCSQLGYMVFICGLSNYNLSLFHLSNHAFFKALLFLGAGAVIHGLGNEQDLRRMGGLRQLFPFTYAMLLIGSLALMGFPFLAGFYSKDLILEIAFAKFSITGFFAYWLGTVAACGTAFYSARLLYLAFLTKTNTFKAAIKITHELPLIMAVPLFILALGSIFLGYFSKDLFVGVGTDFFKAAVYITPVELSLIDAEFIPTFVKLAPTCFSFLGAAMAMIMNTFYKFTLIKYKFSFTKIYNFFNRKWYFDYLYNIFVGYPGLFFSYQRVYKNTDKGIIEVFGPTGTVKLIYRLITLIGRYHTGFIYHYISLIFLTVVFVASFADWNVISNLF